MCIKQKKKRSTADVDSKSTGRDQRFNTRPDLGVRPVHSPLSRGVARQFKRDQTVEGGSLLRRNISYYSVFHLTGGSVKVALSFTLCLVSKPLSLLSSHDLSVGIGEKKTFGCNSSELLLAVKL